MDASSERGEAAHMLFFLGIGIPLFWVVAHIFILGRDLCFQFVCQSTKLTGFSVISCDLNNLKNLIATLAERTDKPLGSPWQ